MVSLAYNMGAEISRAQCLFGDSTVVAAELWNNQIYSLDGVTWAGLSP
jgi:hypothetical protein